MSSETDKLFKSRNELLEIIDKIGHVISINGHTGTVEHIKGCDLCLGLLKVGDMLKSWYKRYDLPMR